LFYHASADTQEKWTFTWDLDWRAWCMWWWCNWYGLLDTILFHI